MISKFTGFCKIKDIKKKGYQQIPDRKGIYVVLRDNKSTPIFLEVNNGGRFKGRNPTVSKDILNNKWVKKTNIMYIGKAGGSRNTTSLRTRIKDFIEFGYGNPRPHWGGRYIWQLPDAYDLFICWRETKNIEPRTLEKELITTFKKKFNNLPFANLKT